MKTNNKIAAIDIGTNSFHLIIVEVQPDGSFKLLDKQREVIRLGSHKGEDLSLISEGEIEKAIDILKNYKMLAEHYGASIRAVATSAVREADNRDKFVEAVKDKTNIDIEVVDGRTEAKLIFYGIMNAIDVTDKNVLCLDIGGGSSEFIYAEKGNPVITESVKIGAVRLSKKFFPDFILKKEAVEACRSYVEAQISYIKYLIEGKKIEQVIGASGTIVAAAILVQELFNKPKRKSVNRLSFTAEELNFVYKEVISKKTPAERVTMPGMELKRADIIPAGLIILKTVFDVFEIKQITLSEYALREGIIYDTILKLASATN
ncbi:MAG: Ppx/GppA phosphatase family protein [Ignavibacterium sp.]|uniref:Ppx/GppA phosphatase family protein n=1 Tax=Ignavibacterium sp. TaxID=2651167 RepID=UPI004049370E